MNIFMPFLLKNNLIDKQADDDADLLIVETALGVWCKQAVIISGDTDDLVLIVALTPKNETHYFLKLGKQGKDNKVYLSNSFNNYPFCKEYIWFLHAYTGCNTTSSYLNRGKKVLSNFLRKPTAMNQKKRSIVFISKKQMKISF